MSKQVNLDKRKGLVRKELSEQPLAQKLKIDKQIDDESLWYVSIDDGILQSKRTCKLSSLSESFEAQKRAWKVTVIGYWNKMNGREFIKF